MAASASSPDGSDFLTSRERKVLAEIAKNLRTTDRSLAEQLTGDGLVDLLYEPPFWVVYVGRVALVSMPVVMFVPFEWWGILAMLASPLVAYQLLHARATDHGAFRNRRDSP
jgi:hypothetical protein